MPLYNYKGEFYANPSNISNLRFFLKSIISYLLFEILKAHLNLQNFHFICDYYKKKCIMCRNVPSSDGQLVGTNESYFYLRHKKLCPSIIVRLSEIEK